MTLIHELKRRKVFTTTVGYVAASALVAGLVWLLVVSVGLPRHFLAAVVILEAVALPLVFGLAWAFDLTPVGVERTGPTPQASRVAVSWRRAMLPLIATILIVLVTVSFVALKKSEQFLNERANQNRQMDK